jgi:hypothetical protein
VVGSSRSAIPARSVSRRRTASEVIIRRMRSGVCSMVIGVVLGGCGASGPTMQGNGGAAFPASLKRALVAAYDKPLGALVRGDAGGFCADFTSEVQRAVAHHLGAANCVAALKPLVRGIGPVSLGGLSTVERAFDERFRDAHRNGVTASIVGPARHGTRVSTFAFTKDAGSLPTYPGSEARADTRERPAAATTRFMRPGLTISCRRRLDERWASATTAFLRGTAAADGGVGMPCGWPGWEPVTLGSAVDVLLAAG